MNNLLTFRNPEFGEIRTVEIDGEPWLVGKDVAQALGYANPRDALEKHVDKEDRNTVAFRDGNRGNPNQTIINESGLYSLILSSKLPDAKKFKRWVTSEVLPTIRKTGGFHVEVIDMTQTLENLTQTVKTLTERLDKLERKKSLPAPKKKATKPKDQFFRLRMTQDEMDMLNAIAGKLCTTKSAAVLCGINRVARDLGVYGKHR